ncbi:MAG TPA: AMP-binding protein [Candidatus Angelobacter sp.]|nr:AMP-binding protein [Candidatus Angelobacter sp.]
MPPSWNNFYERFAATAERFAGLVAIELQRRDGVEKVTFGELRQQAEAATRFLVSRNIRQGDNCAILADNDIAWCAVYLGILRLGAVAVPFDTHYAPQQISTLLRDSGAKILFATDRYAAGAEEARRLAGSSVTLALLRGTHAGFASFCGSCGSLNAAETPLPPDTATVHDPAAILYTSGTTSDPKGVVLTHGNLLAEAEAVFSVLSLDERDAILGVMPLYHSLAQMANLLLPFVVGARVIFLEEVSATELLKALRQYQPTIFCCVPQFFYLIHQRVFAKVKEAGWIRSAVFRFLLNGNAMLRRLTGLNLGRIFFAPVHEVIGTKMRYLVTGGARFDPAVGRDFYKLGFNIIEAYGLTETSGAATLTGPGEGGQGFVGKPLPGIEVKIQPAERGSVDGDLSGEIAIRGPIVMKEYFRRPDATAAQLQDEWFYTGDLGRMDEEGRVFITGRKKEVIVLSSGKNIYPEEIEAQYAQSPFIKELCVVGMTLPGEPAAERLHGVIVPDLEVMQACKVVNMKEVLRFDIENISVHLPAHKRILSYEIRTEPLPRTPTRKLKRFEIERELKSQAAKVEDRATQERPASEEEMIWAAEPDVARALEVLREAAHDKAAVRADANLELDLGLDSIERVELLTNIEQVFGRRIPSESAASIYTVRQLIEAARSQGGATLRAQPANAWNKLLEELSEDDPLFTDLLKPYPIVTIFGFVALRFWNLVARALLRFRVTGIENLPDSGAYLICPNHETYIDAFFLASALSYRVFRKLFYVGASEYFATPLRRMAAQRMHLAPVDPDANLIRALQASAFGLRKGKILVLFPEGERSIDGEVKKFKKGAAILAAHLQVPIVPVAFDGVFPMWPRNRAFSWRAFLPWTGTKVQLRFGVPLRPTTPLQPNASRTEVEAAYVSTTEELRKAVLDLKSSLRGRAVPSAD